MSALYLFVISTGISFLGSLQLGPVNSQVLRAALKKDKTSALLIGFGGCLPEILYAGLAGLLVQSLNSYADLEFYFRIVFILVIGGLGLYYLMHKRKEVSSTDQSRHKRPFLNGFILALLNPQLIFFWSGILVLLDVNMLASAQLLGFSLGAAFGAWLLLLSFAYIGLYLSKISLFSRAQLMDRILGVLLLGISIFEICRLLFF